MPSKPCNCPDSDCGGPQEICIWNKCIKVGFSLTCLLFKSSHNKVTSIIYAHDFIHFKQVRCHNEDFCYNRDISLKFKQEIQPNRDRSGFRQFENERCDDNDAQRVCSVRIRIVTSCIFLSTLSKIFDQYIYMLDYFFRNILERLLYPL